MKKLNIAIVMAALALALGGCAKCHGKGGPGGPCEAKKQMPCATECGKPLPPPDGKCPMKGAPDKPECAKPAPPDAGPAAAPAAAVAATPAACDAK